MGNLVRVVAVLLVFVGGACSEEQAVRVTTPSTVGISVDGDFVLAASWQAAFCETRPNKPECRSQTANRYDATHFALHGLWPQPRDNIYCDVNKGIVAVDKAGRWRDLPRIGLADETRETLDKVMPGARSYLDRHEWIKHGTCYSPGDPQEYFAESLTLLEQLNASPARSLFVVRTGKVVTRDQIVSAFEEAFGAGAGDRVELVCRQDGMRQLIVELRINLSGKITPESALGDLIGNAERRRNDCQAGLIDGVGLQ